MDTSQRPEVLSSETRKGTRTGARERHPSSYLLGDAADIGHSSGDGLQFTV